MTTLIILVIAISLSFPYVFIGRRLAEKWYVPEAVRIASENRVENPGAGKEEEENVESARKRMTYGWLLFGPFESLTDCAFLRMSI
jgi:hypothetical protein